MTEYIIAFSSSTDALAAYKRLQGHGAVIMPVPRGISASCGIALKIPPDKLDFCLEEIKTAGLGFEPYSFSGGKPQKI